MMDLIYMCSKYYLWTALIVLARKSNFVFAPQLQVKTLNIAFTPYLHWQQIRNKRNVSFALMTFAQKVNFMFADIYIA